jgi:hypothetical protein
MGDLADRRVHRLRERQPEGLVGPRLDLPGAPRAFDREAAEGVQEHGLADAAQAGEHHRALGTAGGHPLQRHLELAQLAVAPGELGGPLPGARGVGVPHWVHDGTVSGSLVDSLDFASES